MDTDTKIMLKKLIEEEKQLKILEKKESNFTTSMMTQGGKFDASLYNKQVDKVYDIKRKRRKIKDKIKLLKIKYTPLQPTKLSIDELKYQLINDTYDMFNEYKNKKPINDILDKNYRKLTILFIFLFIIIISYILIQFIKKPVFVLR